MMNLIDKVKKAGVVGAGGAGFPTHIKLEAKNVEYFLVNGAECEPLMHKDRELMIHFAEEMVRGLCLAAEQVGAPHKVVGIKAKNKDAVEVLQPICDKYDVKIEQLRDVYPAGDEYELVYNITGRLIPPQGLPLHVGCVVNNSETLYNLARAEQNIPVTQTFMTITGAVKKPVSVWVPIGMRVRDALKIAGGSSIKNFRVMESGLMMGRLVENLNQPVTKTTGGLIVLPDDHALIQRLTRTEKQMAKIGHSACDQCSYCTELCPRYLLGYDVEPHRVMRSLGFTETGKDVWHQHALLCCQCGLCTIYACPEDLYPREACVTGMNNLRERGKGKWEGDKELKVHPMKEARMVPIKRLMKKLDVTQYDAEAHYSPESVQPSKVWIPLKQHVGTAAEPVVKKGQAVKAGDVLAEPPADKLGAFIHASIAGKVVDIKSNMIVIEA